MSFHQEPQSSEKPIKVKFDLDEMDIEEFDFKPVTKGLGFHHKETERASAPRISRPSSSLPIQEKIIAQKITRPTQQFISQAELSGLYTAKPTATPEVSSLPLSVESVQASNFARSMAFLVDSSIIISTMGLIFWIASYSLGLQIDIVKEFQNVTELSIVSLLLCSLMFVFYFSILDLGQSPGKSLFNISVQSEKDEDLKISQTFLRSIVTLFSMYMLFLPLILDFQNKLSETKVVKN